jgi:hypothetical protein
VYRIDGHGLVGRCDLVDGTHLVGTARATRGLLQTFTDTTATAGKRYTYVVTALDRSNNESRSSLPRFV